jgi:hypothetical protein
MSLNLNSQNSLAIRSIGSSAAPARLGEIAGSPVLIAQRAASKIPTINSPADAEKQLLKTVEQIGKVKGVKVDSDTGGLVLPPKTVLVGIPDGGNKVAFSMFHRPVRGGWYEISIGNKERTFPVIRVEYHHKDIKNGAPLIKVKFYHESDAKLFNSQLKEIHVRGSFSLNNKDVLGIIDSKGKFQGLSGYINQLLQPRPQVGKPPVNTPPLPRLWL